MIIGSFVGAGLALRHALCLPNLKITTPADSVHYHNSPHSQRQGPIDPEPYSSEVEAR